MSVGPGPTGPGLNSCPATPAQAARWPVTGRAVQQASPLLLAPRNARDHHLWARRPNRQTDSNPASSLANPDPHTQVPFQISTWLSQRASHIRTFPHSPPPISVLPSFSFLQYMGSPALQLLRSKPLAISLDPSCLYSASNPVSSILEIHAGSNQFSQSPRSQFLICVLRVCL